MIELDEFEFKAKDYFWMTFWSHLAKRFLVLAYATVFLLACGIITGDWVLPIIVPILVAICFLYSSYSMGRYYAYSKENNAFFQKRKMTFGNSTCHVACEDGFETKVPISRFNEADILYGYYLLFVGNMSFYPIPFSAFCSEEDRIRFETEILGDKLKTKTIPWKKILVFLLVSAFLIGLALLLRGTPKIVKPNINLDSVPQMMDNDEHGSDTNNDEFRPTGSDY